MKTSATIEEIAVVPSNQEPVLSVRNLSISFRENKVLDHFNLDLPRGKNIVVLGKSGSGKSVLIKCIIGLLQPDEGEITILGKNALALSHDELDKLRAKVGFLFQSNALYDSMTVKKNLEFPLRRHWIRLDQEEVDSMVMDVLDNVGLAHTLQMMPAELSGGMRKRIALARTLILRPEIILYDEPTTGLDPITGSEISELMMEMNNKYHTSSLIISHDMRCVKRTADKIAVLLDGKCHALGTYEELSTSKDQRVNQFFL